MHLYHTCVELINYSEIKGHKIDFENCIIKQNMAYRAYFEAPKIGLMYGLSDGGGKCVSFGIWVAGG